MARCGCGSTCNCVITGEGVTGSGSVADPYVIADTTTATFVEELDTNSVDMSVTGSGTSGDPYVVSAEVIYSADADNCAEAGTDGGIYVACPEGGGGGGGLTQTYVGRTSVGGSYESFTGYRILLKKVTIAADGVLLSVGAHIKDNGTGSVAALKAALYADSSGAPGKMVAVGSGTEVGDSFVVNSTAGWVEFSIGKWVTAGDYWLAVMAVDAGTMQIAYDATGGTDRDFTSGGIWWADSSYYTVNTTTKNYSIRATLLTPGATGSSQVINDPLSSTAGMLAAQNGTWAINAGVLRQSDTGAAARHICHATAVTPAGSRIAEVECDWVSGAGGTQHMGLILSSNNSSGQLLVYANSADGGATWTIVVENDGVTNYGSFASAYAGSGYLRIGAVLTGREVDVYVGGVWIGVLSTAFTPGKYVGLYTYGCAADFKNLKAWNPVVSPL